LDHHDIECLERVLHPKLEDQQGISAYDSQSSTTYSTIKPAVPERISEDNFAQNISENSSSDKESVGSVAESIFSTASIISGTSMSSIGIAHNATERLVELILEDTVINALCGDVLESGEMPRERFERNFIRLLRRFAIELRKEAQTHSECQAARLVRFRARNTAHIICNIFVDKSDDVSSTESSSKDVLRSGNPDEGAEVQLDESSDTASDGSEDASTDFQHLEMFVKESRAFANLRLLLLVFVHPKTISSPMALGQEEPSPQQQDLIATSHSDIGLEDTGIKRSIEDSEAIVLMDDVIAERQTQTSPGTLSEQEIAKQSFASEEVRLPPFWLLLNTLTLIERHSDPTKKYFGNRVR
jgi:hypothetical protein